MMVSKSKSSKLESIRRDKSFLNSIRESLKVTYNLSDDQASLLQNELGVTIDQFIENNNLTDSDNGCLIHETNDRFKYVMSVPLDNLNDLATGVNKSIDHIVDLYIQFNEHIQTITSHDDMEGDTFSGLAYEDHKVEIPIGTISRDEKNIWSVRLDKSLPTTSFDFDQYVRCWSCGDNKTIRNFINDIYMRINHLGQYRLGDKVDSEFTQGKLVSTDNAMVIEPNTPDRIILTNESMEGEDDETTYEIEYNPSEIIVYLHENYGDDLDLDESNDEEVDDTIKSFFESVLGVDNGEIVHVNESLGKFIFKAGLAYAIGKGAQMVLNKLGVGIPQKNPYTTSKIELPGNRRVNALGRY